MFPVQSTREKPLVLKIPKELEVHLKNYLNVVSENPYTVPTDSSILEGKVVSIFDPVCGWINLEYY